jgi:diketogulonate reductase-like aldo/keto reductase
MTASPTQKHNDQHTSTTQATAREGNATLLVAQALEAGWRHIDCSLIYRNQNGTGEALTASGVPREELYITSKYDSLTNQSVHEELRLTLAQLQLEYLDLYLIHFPRAAQNGGGLKKVWREMEDVKKMGLARSIGISNYDSVELLEEVLEVAEVFP